MLLVTICLMIVSIATIPSAAIAQVVESDLFTLDEPTSIVFSIEWEGEEPVFTLTAPDGRTIDATATDEDIAIVRFERAYMILVRDAMAGSWRLTYDKGANESITVMVDEYMEGFWITEYEVGAPAEGALPVSFLVEHDENVSYSYTLSLALQEGGADRALYSGTAKTNEPIELDLSLDDVNSHEHYVLKLYVAYEHEGAEYFDLAYSEPFTYANESSMEAMRDIDLYADIQSETLTIEWGSYLPYGANDVLITVTEAGMEEPSFLQSFQRDQTFVSIPYSPEADWTRVEARWRGRDGLLSDPLVKMIEPGTGFQLTLGLPNEDEMHPIVTSARQLSFEYARAVDQQVLITIDDVSEQITLQGDGERWVDLQEGYHTISISYTDEDGVQWTHERELYVDVVPPMLEVYVPFDGITTEMDSFIITGETDPNAILLVNGAAVELSQGGRFTAEIPLEKGDNRITITSSDPAGNESSMQGVIRRGGASTGSAGSSEASGGDTGTSSRVDAGESEEWTAYLPLIVTLMISAALSLWVLLQWRHRQRMDVQQAREEVL